MNTTEALEHFVSLGWPLFPVEANGKRPLVSQWQARATTDLNTLQGWAEAYPNCNWGIHLGGAKRPVSVVDLDGAEGVQEYTDMLGEAPTGVKTPSGGMHVYYEGHLPNSVRKLGNKIDTRGNGGYVLAPGISQIDGKKYVAVDLTPKRLPNGLADRLRSEPRKVTTPMPIDLDEPHNVDAATRYLRHAAPCAIEGDGGDHRTYVVACMVRDYGISEPTCLELMLDHWNDEKASPPWAPDELEIKVKNAFKFAKNDAGSNSQEAAVSEAVKVFDKVAPAPPAQLPSLTAGELLAMGEPPPRRWLIRGWFPGDSNTHTYITGKGGTGKSLFMLQAGLAISGGMDEFLGAEVCEHRPVFLVGCEDSQVDMRHRLWEMHKNHPELEAVINRAELHFVERAGEEDNLLVVADGPTLKPGGLWKPLKDGLMATPGRKLAILDTVGDVYGADQNDNQLVQQFLKTKLNRLAKLTNTTFVLIGHPAKATGSQFGGAVAWENGVRNRLFLDYENPEEPGPRMILTRAKSNWVGPGEKLMIRYEHGAFVTVDTVKDADDNDAAVMSAVRVAVSTGQPLKRSARHHPCILKEGLEAEDGRKLLPECIAESVSRLIRHGRIREITGQREGNGLYPVVPEDIFD